LAPAESHPRQYGQVGGRGCDAGAGIFPTSASGPVSRDQGAGRRRNRHPECSAAVGLIGLGAVGSRIAQLLAAFGSRVLAHDPFADPAAAQAAGASLLSFEEGLAESDIVSVHARLTDDTRGMFSTAALAGGGARSALWCQAISDATDLPVIGPDSPEIGALGAVLTAWSDFGDRGSLQELIHQAVRPGTTYLPRADETALLAAAYQELVTRRDQTDLKAATRP